MAMSCGNFAWCEIKASQPFLFFIYLFLAIFIYPAVASISIYHLLKVTVVTIINPVNRWPRRQDSIYRPLFNSSGKLVLPKSEWGNYFNHLRPSISDLCVWRVHRPLTLRPSLLVSSLWLYFVRGCCTPDNLGGHKTLFYTQAGSVRSVWTRHIWAATCACSWVKRKVVEDKRALRILCCTDLLGSNTTLTSRKCLFREEIQPQSSLITTTPRTVAPLINFLSPTPTQSSTFLFNY